MAPHCIVARVSLVNARLRHVGRVIRGEEDAETQTKNYGVTPSSRSLPRAISFSGSFWRMRR
jgi:hypothetical protein